MKYSVIVTLFLTLYSAPSFAGASESTPLPGLPGSSIQPAATPATSVSPDPPAPVQLELPSLLPDSQSKGGTTTEAEKVYGEISSPALKPEPQQPHALPPDTVRRAATATLANPTLTGTLDSIFDLSQPQQIKQSQLQQHDQSQPRRHEGCGRRLIYQIMDNIGIPLPYDNRDARAPELSSENVKSLRLPDLGLNKEPQADCDTTTIPRKIPAIELEGEPIPEVPNGNPHTN